MHALLVSLGTGGDVYPYVGLGARLRARGHRVTLAANDPFGGVAGSHGLDFHALVSAAETEEFLNHPDLWHPVRSVPFLVRWGVAMLPRQYALLAELARDPATVLVASPGVIPARLVQEKLGRPMASVVLQPWMLPSAIRPSVMPGVRLPA